MHAFRFRHADGSWRYLEASANGMVDDPAVNGVVVTLRDVTERVLAEEMLTDQATILEMISTGAPRAEVLDAICCAVEAQGRDIACAVFLVDEARGRLRLAASPSLPAGFQQALADGVPLQEGHGASATAARAVPVVVDDIATDPVARGSRDDALRYGMTSASAMPIVASGGTSVLGTLTAYSGGGPSQLSSTGSVLARAVRLVTVAEERRAFEEQLAHQAQHDPLTGLPNRVLFMEFLALALSRARRHRSSLAVLFLDLDRFKVVNDSLGHDAGDDLLVVLASRLREVLRPGDTIARFGGDEFTVLCEDLPPTSPEEHAAELADRLLHTVREPFPLEPETYLGASIGIALSQAGAARPDELLRDADAAMYRAKERGRGHWVVFDEAMRASARKRLETETDLHRALEREELCLHFQPIVSLESARCIGAEALIRWNHPERGLLPPSEFVPLAEESGMILPIGQWVIDHACSWLAAFQRSTPASEPFWLAVNLSARQLARPDFVEGLARSLAASRVDPSGMCLEFTESILMGEDNDVLDTIHGIVDLGVSLCVDDFGTGYSSLGYLKRLPVDTVKVDRGFVDGLGDDPDDTAIVAAVAGLGHALGLRVIGEGVETTRQLSALVRLGCDQAQGYLFARPLSADALTARLSRRPPWRPPGAELIEQARGAPSRLRP